MVTHLDRTMFTFSWQATSCGGANYCSLSEAKAEDAWHCYRPCAFQLKERAPTPLFCLSTSCLLCTWECVALCRRLLLVTTFTVPTFEQFYNFTYNLQQTDRAGRKWETFFYCSLTNIDCWLTVRSVFLRRSGISWSCYCVGICVLCVYNNMMS